MRARREKHIDQTLYLSGKRRGAVLKEEVWYEGDRVVKYSLAYINPRIYAADNGRVLGYDNTHEYHHRHFMGQVEKIEFHEYEALVTRFQAELYELWRTEDEQDD
jgi:CHASE1-domain containing sensor protein